MPSSRPIDAIWDARDFLPVVTLVEIGDPAVAPALRKLANETDASRVALLTVVLKNVLGVDGARHRLETERDQATAGHLATTGFDSALKLLEKLKTP